MLHDAQVQTTTTIMAVGDDDDERTWLVYDAASDGNTEKLREHLRAYPTTIDRVCCEQVRRLCSLACVSVTMLLLL